MKQYEVCYFTYTGHGYQKFYVIAKDEHEAKSLFLKFYYTHHEESSIEYIKEYEPPKFYTEESINERLKW